MSAIEERSQRMAQIGQAVAGLVESPLYGLRQAQRYQPVIGDGSLTARIVVIGEAPGESEAKSGRPFVGASGRVLSELLASIGLRREDIYITNVVKDRPPDNRDPTPDEIALYRPFLEAQLEIIQPAVVATLGRFAMTFVFELFKIMDAGADKRTGPKISDVHGKLFQGQASYGPVAVVPLFHPAVALYSTPRKATLLEDFQTLKPFVTGS
jgi:DNA polymerase